MPDLTLCRSGGGQLQMMELGSLLIGLLLRSKLGKERLART